MKKTLFLMLTVVAVGVIIFTGYQLFMSWYEEYAVDELYSEAADAFVVKQDASVPATDADAVPQPSVATLVIDDAGEPLPEPSAEPVDPEYEAEGLSDDAAQNYTGGNGSSSGTTSLTVDFNALQSVNGDIFGWIYIPNTPVSYPLLHGSDNVKYLDTTYNGKKNKFGSIFIDTVNAPSMTDRHTLIYGHKISGDSMFGTLANYRRQDYYESHRYIYILTPEGNLTYEVIGASHTQAGDGVYTLFYTDAHIAEFVDYISQRSAIAPQYKGSTTDNIITLSTCTSPSRKEERFVVHAALVSDTRTVGQSRDVVDLKEETAQ